MALRILEALLTALGLAGVVTTLLPLSRSKVWWVRIWDFPRPQIAAVSALALIGLAVLRNPRDLQTAVVLTLLGVCILVQARRILPYTRLWRRQMVRARMPAGERSLGLLVVNVLMTNRDLDRLLPSIEAADPDLVLALEVDAWWVEQLAAALPEHRFHVLHPLDNTYGMALLSRLELEAPVIRFLLRREIPSIRTRVRLRSGEPVLLYALHPEPPSPPHGGSSLERDAELILVGRTSRLFQRLSGLLDPRVGRGLYSTFHARWPLLRWPLDHLFASKEFMLRDIRLLPDFGSDHFPIFAAFDYTPAAPPDHVPERAQALDHIEAHQTLRKAGARPVVGPAPPRT
jgi:endonuclease/exonuclease/phosphatase (EEP) superfamily protein YafD